MEWLPLQLFDDTTFVLFKNKPFRMITVMRSGLQRWQGRMVIFYLCRLKAIIRIVMKGSIIDPYGSKDIALRRSSFKLNGWRMSPLDIYTESISVLMRKIQENTPRGLPTLSKREIIVIQRFDIITSLITCLNQI